MSPPEALEDEPLPGQPGPRLRALYEALTPAQRRALRSRLLGDLSAETLARILTKHGHPIGATTIKTYRRSLRQTGA